MPSDTSLEGITIVFDLDGTLIDTAPDLAAAMNACLVKAGYDAVDADLVKGQIGLGSRAMIVMALDILGHTLSDTEIDALRADMILEYRQNIASHSKPYPGCIDALDRLEAAGARFAVCTNKPHDLADRLLHALGLHNRFDAVVGSTSGKPSKPNPEHIFRTLEAAGGQKTRAVMIGDSNPDERAAQDAGLPFIFIPFGYGPIDLSNHPRIELADYAALSPSLVTSLF